MSMLSTNRGVPPAVLPFALPLVAAGGIATAVALLRRRRRSASWFG